MRSKEWEVELANVLRETFAQYKKANPRYSMRAFAKKIGVSSGTLSDIINYKKKWQLRPVRAAQILELLNVETNIRNRILTMMGLTPVHDEHALREDDYAVLTEWIYQPILCAFSLPEKEQRPSVIGAKLGITEAQVERVIDDALSRGLLVRNEKGGIERPEEYLKSGDSAPSKVIRMHHAVNIGLAGKSLDHHAPDRRDFTSLTFVGDRNQIDELRKEIRALYLKASSLMMGNADHSEVFRLSVQLFPMDFRENPLKAED